MKYEIETTNIFDEWVAGLKDKTAANRIMTRIYRIENGNFGDHKDLGSALFELRLFFGPGYRMYYTIKGSNIVLLLLGGDKSSQKKDIKNARAVMASLEETDDEGYDQ